MEKLRVLDLFSGIGGFSLGLERTGGFETVAFCEIEEYPRKVLKKHWPDVYIHNDIKTLTKDTLWEGYAQNALLNQLCKEGGGNIVCVRDAITNIKNLFGEKTQQSITNGPQNVEEALLIIMAGNVSAAGKANTRFWQLTTNLIMEAKRGTNTISLGGRLLSREDFLTIIRFFVITATWRNPYMALAHIKTILEINGYEDVTKLTSDILERDGISVDVITGGFPCQDISIAGRAHGVQVGFDGERSSLFDQIIRIAGELGSDVKCIILENVTDLLRGPYKDGKPTGEWFGYVLSSLANIGFDAKWEVIPAYSVGSIQRRERVIIIAYPSSIGIQRQITSKDIGKSGQGWAGSQEDMQHLCDNPFERGDSWPQPLIRGMDGRVSNWVDRIKGCGNSIHPSVSELIGRAILESMNGKADK